MSDKASSVNEEENANGKRANSETESGANIQPEEKKQKVEEKVGGILLFCGVTDYDKRNDDKLVKDSCVKWSPTRFEVLKDVRIRKVCTSASSFHFFAIGTEGVVYAWGFNKKGQLGLGDCKNRRNPSIVKSLSGYNIVDIKTGRSHSLFLTDEGQVFSCGENKLAQCGNGKKDTQFNTPTAVATETPIIEIACGADFSLILTETGKIFSFGYPEYGHLGLGSENKYIEKAQKVAFMCEYTPIEIQEFIIKETDSNAPTEITRLGQPTIKHIACGADHSVAIDDLGRCFTWGFGGYGRLGHNSTANEYVPRMMKCWYRITGQADRGVVKVTCGKQFNMVETIKKQMTYMFGQFRINSEASMYPKPIDDLQGWNVREIACGQTGWACAADDKVIASFPSPCIGQLGMGEKKKSSAPPTIVETLKGVYCIGVGLGYLHTLYIVRDETPKDKSEIEKFLTMTFVDN